MSGTPTLDADHAQSPSFNATTDTPTNEPCGDFVCQGIISTDKPLKVIRADSVYLDIDKNSMICLVQSFIGFRFQGQLKWNLSFSIWKSAGLGNLNVVVKDLDWLKENS